MAPEPTPAPSPVAPGVAFEVDRFEWTAADRLELVGRWSGLRGHRFLRPTLDVEVGAERRRMLADLEHKPWAPEEGQDWIAVFTWRGEPAHFDGAELTVSPELAVQLPAPDGSAAKGASKTTTGAERRPARRPRTAVLEGELAAALTEAERLAEELERARASHSEAGRELRERLRGEHAKIRNLEAELDQAREQAREQFAAAEAAAAEEAAALRSERDAAAAERDEATAARDAAAAAADEARAERDEALAKLRAAEAERAALTEARDRARQERNAWMSRARAAKAGRPRLAPEPAPPPTEAAPTPAEPEAARPPEPDPLPGAVPAQGSAPEAGSPTPPETTPAPGPPSGAAGRRTIQIGERPGPVRPAPPSVQPDRGPRPLLEAWAPRIAAVLALIVVVVVLVLLLS
jgi:hypothetical protein